MKNHNILSVLFIALAFSVSSCKKSSSVVGDWTLSGIQGNATYITVNSGGNDTNTVVTTYNNGVVTVVKTELPGAPINSSYTYTLSLNIQSNALLNATESILMGNVASATTFQGNWYYLSSNTTNDGIVLQLPGSYLTGTLAGTSSFVISSVSGSQLVLTATDISTLTNGAGQSTNSTMTLTFTK